MRISPKSLVIAGGGLQALLPLDLHSIDVRYANTGDLALKVTGIEARVLARACLVEGFTRSGRLRYLVALCPKSTIERVLSTDAARPGEITRTKQVKGAKNWVTANERADIGFGGARGAGNSNPFIKDGRSSRARVIFSANAGL